MGKATSSDERDTPLDQSQEQLIELMADYQSSIAENSSFDASVAAKTLDSISHATFVKAQRALRLLARVRPYFAESTSKEPTPTVDFVASLPSEQPTGLDAPVDRGAGSNLPATFGRFEIVSELGHGGLGVVFLARDPLLKRSVALKIPRPDALFTFDLRQRFTREAQAAARLTHPNIVQVYEIGEVGPICFIASAYCEGQNLADWIRRQVVRPTQKQIALLIASLADAMHYSHSQGVLHRDLKPSNVLLEPCHTMTTGGPWGNSPLPFIPRIADFGLAKINDLSAKETRHGSMLGTPAYMSPEQAEGRIGDIDCRSDVYGLGAILYELLVGSAPFHGNSEIDTLQRVLTEDVRFPRDPRYGLSPDLMAICSKCMEKSADARYTTCAALADDLRRFLTGEPTLAKPVGPVRRSIKWLRRRPTIAALIAVSVCAALTIIAGTALYSRQMFIALSASELSRHQADVAREEAVRQQHNAEASRNEALRERDANEQYAYAGRMRQAFKTLTQGDIKAVAGLLSPYIEGAPYSYLRGFEWHYLNRSLHGERLVLRGHVGEVYGVAISPDGKRIVSSGQDGTIRVWNQKSGQMLRTIQAHPTCANDVDWSPDGRFLASASCDHTVKIWDTRTWREAGTICKHDDNALCVRFSPDGKQLASGDAEGAIRIWSAPDGVLVTTLRAKDIRVAINSVEWSPDGSRLFAPCDDIFNWDTTTWEALDSYGSGGDLTVAISKDGKYLATNSLSGVQVRDALNGELLNVLPTESGRIHKVLFSADGQKLFSCGADRMVRIWDVASTTEPSHSSDRFDSKRQASEVRALIGHVARVQSIAISPDGHTGVTASFDGTVGVWDLEMKQGLEPLFSHTVEISSIPPALASDLSRMTTTDLHNRRSTWDLTKPQQFNEPDAAQINPGTIYAAANSEAFALLGHDRKTLSFCRAGTPTLTSISDSQIPDVGNIVFSRDSRSAATLHLDGSLRVFDAHNGQVRTLVESGVLNLAPSLSAAGPVALALSNSTKLLAFSQERGVITDLQTMERIPFPPMEGSVWELHFSEDERLLFARCLPNTVHIIDSRTGQLLHTIRKRSAPLALACSPDSKTLAISIPGHVTLWHVATGQEITDIMLPPRHPYAIKMQFSADGRKLGVITSTTIDGTTAEESLYVW